MKKCENCGAVCPDEVSYCGSCGAPFLASQQPVPPSNQAPGQPPFYPPPYNQPIPPYNQPPYPPVPGPGYGMQKRTAPLVLGIIGIVFGVLLPLVTYACSIPGLVMANKDIKMGLDNQSGRVLNIIAIVIAAVNSIMGILQYSSSSFFY